MTGPDREGAAGGAEPDAAAQVRAAEERGAETVREQIREVLETERRVVRVGGSQVEVVQAEVLEQLLEP